MAKLLRPPHVKLLVSTLLLAALAALALTACATPAAEVNVPVDRSVFVVTVPAMMGSIATNRAYAARVDASDQVGIVPRASGQVARLDVGVGARVSKGDVLGKLEHGALDARLKEAQSKVTIAEARLAQVKAAVGPNLAAAQARLDAARAKLAQLQNPTRADVQMAESVLADARSRMRGAQVALDRLLDPTPADLETVTSAVVTARNNLNGARIHLAQLKDPTSSDLLVAQSAAEAARKALSAAQADLAQLNDPSSTTLRAAESAVNAAERDVASAETRLAQLLDPPIDVLARAQSDVAVAQQALTAVLARQDDPTLSQTIASELTRGSIGEPWPELTEVRTSLMHNADRLRDPGLNVNLTPEQIAGLKATVAIQEKRLAALLGQVISSSSVPDRLMALIRDESQARLDLESARARLAELHNPTPEDVAAARGNVEAAQARLDSARARYDGLTNPGGRSMEREEGNVTKASAALEAAEARLAELQDPTGDVITLAEGRVETAEAVLEATEARLMELKEPDANTVAQAQERLAGAKALAESAAARLEMLQQPDDVTLANASLEIAVAVRELATNSETYAGHGVRAAVGSLVQAQAQVALVEKQLEDMKLVAPFDGIVIENQQSVGAIASPQTPVFTVATTDVVVSFLIEETMIGGVEEGRVLEFTSPAVPDQALDLMVDRIAPTAGATGHTFLVKMEPVAGTPALRPGVSGQVSVSIQRTDTLLVPREAVFSSASQSSAYVVRDGVAHLQPVAVGLADDRYREILDGLQLGDEVVVSGQHLLTDATPVTVAGPAATGMPAS